MCDYCIIVEHEGFLLILARLNTRTYMRRKLLNLGVLKSLSALPDIYRMEAYLFDWVDDYIEQSPYSTGVVTKASDGIWEYWQCYNGGINLWVQPWLDSRSVQTIKVRFNVDSYAASGILFSYWTSSVWYMTVSVASDGKIQVELQGTWSWRIKSTTVIVPWQEYNVVVRINNTLPSGTARVVGDADIFINGAKETKSFSATGNQTGTNTVAGWGVYSNTLMNYGKLRSCTLWSTNLSDADCIAESNSATILQISGLAGNWTTRNTSMVLGRTWFNLTNSGNLVVSSDADGTFFDVNGNRDHGLSVGTRAELTGTWPTLNQNASFTMKVRMKFNALAISNTANGIFWYNFWCSIFCDTNTTSGLKARIREWWSFVDISFGTFSLNTLYDLYLVYDATQQKAFFYNGTTLINVGWTAIAFAFADSTGLYIWDNAIGGGNPSSGRKSIYHACIWNRALSLSDITADVALGNTLKSDPTIIAYYTPANMQYSRQYVAQPNNLTGYLKWSWTTVTANTATAPDGTMTADTVTWTWTSLAVSACYCPAINTLSGTQLASKTVVVKAFVRTASWTAAFRLRCAQRGVADNYSTDFTATTTWQEFTFTQVFTSSTSATWMDWGLVADTTFSAASLIVRGVRIYITSDTLFDESPNIWWYLWWRTNIVLSAWVKPTVDAVNNQNSQCIIVIPYVYIHLRGTTNDINFRSDTKIAARTAWVISLGSGFRDKVHITGYKYRDGSVRRMKLYVNWVLQWWSQTVVSVDPWDNSIYNTQAVAWRFSSTQFAWYNWDIRAYKVNTYTDFTDADALNIKNWGEPSTAEKMLHRKPTTVDTSDTVMDWSAYRRYWKLRGWPKSVPIPG